MLQLLTPATDCRVTLVAEDGIHSVATQIPYGESFDPVSLAAYAPLEIVSVEVFPPAYVITCYFEHISDLDPWEWESGQRKTHVVSFPSETGKLSRAELTKLKASCTGYRLVSISSDKVAANIETEF